MFHVPKREVVKFILPSRRGTSGLPRRGCIDFRRFHLNGGTRLKKKFPWPPPTAQPQIQNRKKGRPTEEQRPTNKFRQKRANQV